MSDSYEDREQRSLVEAIDCWINLIDQPDQAEKSISAIQIINLVSEVLKYSRTGAPEENQNIVDTLKQRLLDRGFN